MAEVDNRQLFVQLACIWEVTARKPGNVHRFMDFDDLQFVDFLNSAAAVAPILGNAEGLPIGPTILQAVQATRKVCATNTNLGIILLLAPLCAVPLDTSLSDGVTTILDQLDVIDSLAVYEAIRLAQPGGLGKSKEQDITDEPSLPLREIMAMAADRDLIARQYSNGFREVLEFGVNALGDGLESLGGLEAAIIHCHLSIMAQHPDSLIARKRGQAEAEQASRRAAAILAASAAHDKRDLDEFDQWLRAEGHARNPGTTADLTCACLFAALREDMITLPPQIPWPCG